MLGADHLIDASSGEVPTAVFDLTGGAHVSLDCLGHASTANTSILSLRPLGRHVQIGLFPAAMAEIAISRVIRDELEVLGVHGLSAGRLDRVLALVSDGRLDTGQLVTDRITLDGVAEALPAMGAFARPGVTLVTF